MSHSFFFPLSPFRLLALIHTNRVLGVCLSLETHEFKMLHATLYLHNQDLLYSVGISIKICILHRLDGQFMAREFSAVSTSLSNILQLSRPSIFEDIRLSGRSVTQGVSL